MRLRWADYCLDTEARTLERRGAPVRIKGLAFDLLALLLRHRGRLVSDALVRRELWPDVTVSDSSLRQVLKDARRAIGDDGRQQKAIKTVRGQGMRFVANVTSDAGTGAGFVGRVEVLAALERDFDEAEAGRGGVTLLAGRAGIGKSSTLTELAGRGEARGWRVLEALARAGAEADAYALWANVAHGLGIPPLASSSDALPASGGISDSSRFAQFRALERALARSARAQPLLLCFDDLQFADRESLALLRFLAPALRGLRVRVVGGHRPVGPNDGHTHDLVALAAESATRVVELHGLAAYEISALVAARFGTAPSAKAAEELAVQTRGSPLLALEVARAIAATGTTLDRAGPEQIAASVALGVVPLVRRRLASLAPETCRALHAAAASGDPFEPAFVGVVTSLSREEMERAWIEAERAALIERQGERAFRFSHPLFAEAVGEDLAAQGSDAESALSLRVFEALEGAGEKDAFRIATHALRARARLAPALVVDRLRRAARAAWSMNAVADAESWQQRAVEVAETAALPPLELCDALLELGELMIPNSGVIPARVHLDRAARIARDHGDAVRLARAALGLAHRALALDAQESVISWLRIAHAAPCGDASLEARVAARLGAELLAGQPKDRAAGDHLLREGVARVRRLGNPLDLARVLADQSIAFFSAADPRGALALAREVVGCGRHAGDAEIEFRGLAEIATLHVELGDRAGVDEAIAACETFVHRVPIPYGQGTTHGMAAMVALLDGRLDDASAAMHQADRYGQATGRLGFGVVAGLQRFLLARERGSLAEVVPALDRARVHLPHVPGLGALAGLAHARCGNTASARDAAERLLPQLEALPLDRTRLATLAVAAELAWLTRSLPLARALDPLLAPFEALHAVVGYSACYFGSIAHALGHTAAVLGRRAEALAFLERSRHAHEAMGSLPWACRSAATAAEVRRVHA
jgi:DNA-binding winged helix-turn-helix (wHTH) protein